MTNDPLKPAAMTAVSTLLAPVIPLLLELGIGVGDFETLTRQLYVESAQKMADGAVSVGGGRARTSRRRRVPPARSGTAAIAMLTGLTRAAVMKVLQTGRARDPDSAIGQPRAERVIAGWLHDPEFRDDRTGKPALLALRGEGPSFTSLVKRHSGDPRVRTIRNELQRVQAIRRHPDGRLELIRETYAPSSFDSDGIALLGEYARDYIQTLVHNVQHPPGLALYVRRVVNDNLDSAEIGKLHRDIALQADATMESIDAAVNDPSATVSAREQNLRGVRFGASFFIFQGPNAQDTHANAPKTIGRRQRRASRSGRSKTGKRQ